VASADLTNGGCDEPQLPVRTPLAVAHVVPRLPTPDARRAAQHDASPTRSPPCMSVPPPPSPVAQQHAFFVGDTGAFAAEPCRRRDDAAADCRAAPPTTETFFEPHAQLRLPPRASYAADRKVRSRGCVHSTAHAALR
jgi:hypothetical protein